MKTKTASPDALKLLMDASLALATLEENGMGVDVDYLKKAMEEITAEVKEIETSLRKDDVFKAWRRRFAEKTNIHSPVQLGTVLFDVLKYTSTEKTASGRPKTDETALTTVDIPFVKDYLRMKKLLKARDTYLKGILRETVDGRIHPSFKLNTVQTYRGSVSDPNVQNMPIRNKRMGKLIRSCFVARPGWRIVEVDFNALEVRVSAFYHKDPAWMEYMRDPKKDMHRDVAAMLFKLPKEEITREARYTAKNMFVFPQFYGDYYLKNALDMWGGIDRMQVKTVSGVPIKEYLASVGIHERGRCDPKQKPRLGTFEHHVQCVERDYWGRMFPTYAKWKEDSYVQYRRDGGFSMLTGFRVEGLLDKNKVLNYPIQGVAYHLLLKSIMLLQKRIRKLKMQSLLINQIHDSILGEVPDGEVQTFLTEAKRIMTEEVPAFWEWVCVPLRVEMECSPVGASWFDKEEWVRRKGIWQPKETK